MFPNLPLEILFDIFLKTKDYKTLCNFTLLNKKFYDYLKVNSSYKHRFKVLSKEVFYFLENFSKEIPCNTSSHSSLITNADIYFVLNLYRKFLFVEFEHNWTKRYINFKKNGENMCNSILTSGPKNINNIISIKANRNKISLKKKKEIVYKKFLPFLFLQKKFYDLDFLLKKENNLAM